MKVCPKCKQRSFTKVGGMKVKRGYRWLWRCRACGYLELKR